MKLGTVQGRAGVKISGKIVQDKEHLCISFSSVQGKLSYLQGASPSSTVDISNVQGAFVSCKCPMGNCSGCNYSRSKCVNPKFSRRNCSRCNCVQGEIIQCAIIQGVIVFNVQMCRVQEEV